MTTFRKLEKVILFIPPILSLLIYPKEIINTNICMHKENTKILQWFDSKR